MIIYIDKLNIELKVYALLDQVAEEDTIYWTEKGHIFGFQGNVIRKSGFVAPFYSNYCGEEYVSENEMINGWYLHREFCADFESNEDEILYQKRDKVIKSILPEIYEKIEIDYIKWLIRKGKLELWKNSFEDRIHIVSNTEYYIDDKTYDIFYDLSNTSDIEIIRK